jgi:serine/threonine protein kinase
MTDLIQEAREISALPHLDFGRKVGWRVWRQWAKTWASGSGSFGEVYFSENPSWALKIGEIGDNEIKALKILGKAGASPKLISGRIAEESSKLGGVDGEHYGHSGWVVMERAIGTTWSTRAAELGHSGPELDNLFDLYWLTRRKMHLSGVAHMDLHGHNMIYDKYGNSCQIIDLGLAVLDPRAALQEALGATPGIPGLGRYNYFNLPFNLCELEPGEYSETHRKLLSNYCKVVKEVMRIKEIPGDRYSAENLLKDLVWGNYFDYSFDEFFSRVEALSLLKIFYSM